MRCKGLKCWKLSLLEWVILVFIVEEDGSSEVVGLMGLESGVM